MIRVGTAGWALPAPVRERFPPGPTVLQRYAGLLPAVEINSSFYRPHRRATYARWAAAVPDRFRFSVKLPRSITHETRLVAAGPMISAFLDQVGGLRPRLGVLLVQLPPSLPFEAGIAEDFFGVLGDAHDGQVACEPRHPTWFEGAADELLRAGRVARVAADPAIVPGGGEPGGWPGMAYWRLHGSPRIYHSAYSELALDRLAATLARGPAESWCIFDNTAGGAAAGQALDLLARLPRTHLS